MSRVLVLIPSYNHAPYIEERIESVLRQSFADIDVRVIDDCSTDDTMQRLSRYGDKRMTVQRREKNTGSPFFAWQSALELLEHAGHEYIWIAESDDVAHERLLERAVNRLDAEPGAAVYYCHSWSIDERSLIVGHSINYLKRHFAEVNWERAFTMPGESFRRVCLVKGMAIPNMSSAVMRASKFAAAFDPKLVSFRLAGDWAFAGRLAAAGDVIFDCWDGNSFRRHARTSRQQCPMHKLLFEYYYAVHSAYGDNPALSAEFEASFNNVTNMFLHERPALSDFLSYGMAISPAVTLKAMSFIVRQKASRAEPVTELFEPREAS